MTEEVMERVKEKIWQTIDNYEQLQVARPDNNYREEMVDQILSIPEILIKDPDQSLPQNESSKVDITFIRFEDAGYRNAQRDMLKENWVKVLPEDTTPGS